MQDIAELLSGGSFYVAVLLQFFPELTAKESLTEEDKIPGRDHITPSHLRS